MGLVAAAAPAEAAGPNAGKRTCAEINPAYSELKHDSGDLSIGQVITDGTLSVTITDLKMKDDPEIIGFTGESNIPVSHVILKGSNTTLVYSGFPSNGAGGSLIVNPFQPPAKGLYLYTPFKQSNGKHYGLSYVAFCYLES
jgi:hypothetical protein